MKSWKSSVSDSLLIQAVDEIFQSDCERNNEKWSCPYPRREGLVRSRVVGPVSLSLGTRWRWVVKFTLRPLYLRGEFRYSLNSSEGGLQSRSAHLGQERNFLILPEIETWFIGSLVNIPRTLERFHRSVCEVTRNCQTDYECNVSLDF